MERVRELLTRQVGIVARPQLLASGLTPNDVRRLLRRRELVVVHPGVYATHTGGLTWLQTAWAAVLAVWPAALCHRTAIRAANGPGRRTDVDGPLHLAVDRHRSVDEPAGVRLHRLAGLEAKVLWNLSPPRVRIEHAVVDVAAEARTDLESIHTLADAVQARLTTAARLGDALASRSRIARRELMTGVLIDIGEGACSVLEHGYLDRVERAHGLPRSRRQVAASSRGPIYRDVEYSELGCIVELDGRFFHDSAAARDADLDRDLTAAVDGRVSVRLGWGQVFGRQCWTAQQLGRILQVRGWDGEVRPCPRCAVPSAPRSGVTA
jgi:hypothetical protein